MKEQKPIDELAAGAEPSQPEPPETTNGTGPMTEQKPQSSALATERLPRPELRMETESQGRKTRGRLSRDVMGKLGKTLEAYYDDVRKEGVPDRFKDLLKQLDERKDKESD
jgi:hypothetical protein